MTKTFRCAGDLGDATYSLCIVKHFGGGAYFFEAANYTRVRLTEDKWKCIEPLFRAQPYITDVQQWDGRAVDVNLNDFRALLFRSLRVGAGKDTSLLQWMVRAHQCPAEIMNQPWLTAEPKRIARVVFNRTGPGRPDQHKYHNADFPWHLVWETYGKEAVFVGLKDEYDHFCAVCGRVPHYQTDNLLQVAEVISGCDLFCGNQSLPLSIAYGLGKPVVVEIWKAGPNSCLHRPNATFGWDQNVNLPAL